MTEFSDGNSNNTVDAIEAAWFLLMPAVASTGRLISRLITYDNFEQTFSETYDDISRYRDYVVANENRIPEALLEDFQGVAVELAAILDGYYHGRVYGDFSLREESRGRYAAMEEMEHRIEAWLVTAGRRTR